MDVTRIRISLFGPFSFTVDGRQVRFPTRGAERLLAYLLLKRGRPVPRRTLAGTLWPDSDDVRAARNLNTTLWRVRRTLADQMIQNVRFQSDQVQIATMIDTTEIDVIKFHALAADVSRLSGEKRMSAMLQAEGLYTGDLLEGFDDEWVVPERAATRTQYISILSQLVAASLTSENYAPGLTYAGKLVAMDPLNEDGHRAVMLLSFLSGNRSGALAHYRQLKLLLNAELGVEPSRETVDLWSHIQSGGSDSSMLRRSVIVGR
jgi:DNA-binding SARP family transcriptional activator